jgi:hypothetical protein
VSVHIPDVARMYGLLYESKVKLDRAIAELRKTIIENDMPRDIAHELFYETQTDAVIQGLISKLSLHIEDANNLKAELEASNAKRGRKFKHFQKMLDELLVKTHKIYGKHLEKYGIVMQDVPE